MKINPPALLGSFFGLATVEALGCLVYLLANPGDQNNSVSRLAVVALLLVTMLLCAWLTGLSITRRGWAEQITGRFIPNGAARGPWAWIIIAAVSIFLWLVACLPAYRLGSYALYFGRLQPWLVWAMLVSLQTLLVFLVTRSGITWTDWKRKVQEERKALFASVSVLALFLLFWLVVGVSRLGLTRDVFWDRTGVPLLNLQIVAALAVSLVAAGLGAVDAFRAGKFRPGKWLDVVIFLVIWAVAAVAWNNTPQTHSHFAPGPYPPNYEYYPYSDAMIYDLDAQYPLIGIDAGSKGHVIDKPLYSTFLVYLHAIVGEDITSVVNLQVVLLAVFPALLYLLGTLLHSRPVGLLAAVLAIFKEINAIRGSLIIWTVSTPKMLMSEFPTAIGLVLLCLLVFLWLRDTRKKPVYAMAAGGVLGLMTLVRNNPWFLLPVIFLIAWFVYGRQWKRWLAASGLFFLVLLIAIAPWEWRNIRVRGTPFYFLTTLEHNVWENRYLPALPTAVVPTSKPSGPDLPGAQSTSDITIPPVSGGGSLSRFGAVFFFVANNFSHNLIASALTLPTTLLENDLDHIINEQGSASLWAADWNGSLSLEAIILLLFELLLIAVGVGYCWSRWRIAGLAPLLLSLAYMLAVGLARTSGGRYIVPADWLTYFYFGMGLMQVCRWVASLRQPVGVRRQLNSVIQPAAEIGQPWQGEWRGGLAAMLVVFLVGLSLPLSSKFFSNPFLVETKSGVLKVLAEDGLLDKLSVTPHDLESFSSDPGSFLAYGRAFFPRYLDYKTDLYAKEIYNDLPKTAPHLVFEMIVPTAWNTIDMPMESSPAYFPNAADVIVLGCKSAHYVDGLAVVILGQHPVTYLTSPKKSLSCPQ